jgi:sarcosine oxidase
MRSHELWRGIEARTGRSLLTVTGGLWISSPARQAETHVANFFDNTVAAARRFGIAHEILDAAAIRARFPQFDVAGNEMGYFEPGAGFVRPEACIAAQLELARKAGAEVRLDEPVEEISEDSAVRVRSARASYQAAQAIVCTGAWVRDFLPASHAGKFSVTRQVSYWFETHGPHERFSPPAFPVFIWELQRSRSVIYGFPAIDGPGGGLKVGTEQYSRTADPDDLSRKVVTAAEAREMHEALVGPHLPGVGPACVKSLSCLYTATPDFHFVVDRHPAMPRVIVASPCSGHGFKHSAALGEAIAARVSGDTPRVDLSAFAWR